MTEKSSISNSENSLPPVSTANEFVIAVRDLSAPNHLRFVQPEDFRINEGKRKLIIFPGGKTMTPEQGNGMCKLTEKEFFSQLFLEDNGKKLSPKAKLEREKAYYQAAELRDQYEICVVIYNNRNRALQVQQFFDAFLVPLVAQKDALGQLHRLDSAEAAANMRCFTASAHCYGAYLLKEIDEEFGKLLPELGYTPQECNEIARQSVVFNHNNVDEDLGVHQPNMLHIQRLPQHDDALPYEACRPGTYQRFIKGEKYGFEGPCIDELSAHEMVLLAPQISLSGQNEHEGYWLPPAKKSAVGVQEEKLFQAIATEVLSASEPRQDVLEILTHTSQKHRKDASLLKKARENGTQHMAKFENYCDKVAIVARMTASGRRFL
ncbi:MAG: hypothetical protein J6Y91_05495 [Alphaproteobacteria bacterium]|nr:hypothetical protein [Alphaproteobacteria bacterium]